MLTARAMSACTFCMVKWQAEAQTEPALLLSPFSGLRFPTEHKVSWKGSGGSPAWSLTSLRASKSRALATPFCTLCKQFTFFTGKAEQPDMK